MAKKKAAKKGRVSKRTKSELTGGSYGVSSGTSYNNGLTAGNSSSGGKKPKATFVGNGRAKGNVSSGGKKSGVSVNNGRAKDTVGNPRAKLPTTKGGKKSGGRKIEAGSRVGNG